MSTWLTCLKTLERMRAKFVAENDNDKARELVRRAAIFARFMVNTPVSTSEKWFSRYMAGGPMPGFHRKEAMAINRWAKKLDAVAFLQLTDWQQWRELMKVDGLGPAKAAMAVSLIGGKLACIDRHVYAYFTVQESHEVEREYKREVTAGKYQTLHRRFFTANGTARDTQWRLFEKKVPAFAESGHWPYFENIFDLA